MKSTTVNNPRENLAQVQRPLLPTADHLQQYLERIEVSRWYSNRGPLTWELEGRLAKLFGSSGHNVVTASSGTAALEAAILVAAGPAEAERPLVLLPSYTFIATALAAIRCGYQPHFIDVDSDTWMLDPERVAENPICDRAGLILPVAAFGQRPDIAGWESLQSSLGIPVVFDAAAAFEQFLHAPGLVSTTIPIVFSFHATKSFTTAEGGAILWDDHDMLTRVGQMTNFGMNGDRDCLFPGLNGKLSEYHAAVGLACLDDWTSRADNYRQIAQAYRHHAKAAGLQSRLVTTPKISSAYVLLNCRDATTANSIEEYLCAAGLGVRRWYGHGLHKQPVFADIESGPLPVTEMLAAQHLGLSAAVDLTQEDIAFVVQHVAEAERGGAFSKETIG